MLVLLFTLGLGTTHGLPAQSMDPCFILDSPWIVQIHTTVCVIGKYHSTSDNTIATHSRVHIC